MSASTAFADFEFDLLSRLDLSDRPILLKMFHAPFGRSNE
jgi:hypothetical protein